jgi:hypothetical protein
VDSITEQLGQLQELTDEQLAELENSAITEFDGVSKQDLTPQNVDNMEQLANAVEACRAEKSRRTAEMEQLSAKAAEAAARVNPPDLEDPEDVADGGADEDSEGDGTGAPAEQPEDMPADAPPASPDDPSVVPNPGNGDDEKLKKPVYSNESGKAAELSNASTEEAPPAAPASANTAPAAAEAAAQPETPEAASPAAAEASSETPDVAAAASEDDPKDKDEDDDKKSTESAAEGDTASTDAPAEAEANTEAEASENTPDNTTNPEAPVTAAAQGNGGTAQAEPPADRKPVLKPAAATMTITAGADIPGITAGTTFNDMKGVAEAFTKRLHSLRHVNGGDGEQHIVASLQFEYPEDRTLDANDPTSNTDKIFEITGPEALTAAAGICLPLETRYDLGCEVGVTDRPIRDALARFAADRGGIRYFSSPLLTDEANATGFWRGTGTNGAPPFHTYGPDRTTATSPADLKPCLEVQCVAENTAYIEAITLCLTFNNLTTRTFPELIARHNELALVAHARIAENALLAQLEAGSTAITAQGQVVGATREIMNLLGKAVASYRFKHRMNSVQPLRMIAPMWVMDLMRADLALQMPGDGMNDTLGVAESQINTWFRSRGVNITWHLDGVGPATADLDGAGSGTAVGFQFPSTLEFGLWAEGTWLYLDGGTLDLGVIRDSGLVATNQYKQFVETFEGVANMGCDSYWVTAAYAPSGQAAALVDTLP